MCLTQPIRIAVAWLFENVFENRWILKSLSFLETASTLCLWNFSTNKLSMNQILLFVQSYFNPISTLQDFLFWSRTVSRVWVSNSNPLLPLSTLLRVRSPKRASHKTLNDFKETCLVPLFLAPNATVNKFTYAKLEQWTNETKKCKGIFCSSIRPAEPFLDQNRFSLPLSGAICFLVGLAVEIVSHWRR